MNVNRQNPIRKQATSTLQCHADNTEGNAMASPDPQTAPIYQSQKPNESVRLYDGPLQFEMLNNVAHGDGAVTFNWLPWPRICIEMSITPPAGIVQGEGILTTPDGRFRCGALLNRRRLGADNRDDGLLLVLSGQATEPVSVGAGHGLASVVFHVANFHSFLVPRPDPAPPDYGVERIKFAADGWVITLEAVENLTKLKNSLKECSGLAFTHVGRMERSDGSLFDAQQASDVLDCLFCFLSFSRGQWSPALLPVGLNTDGTQVWWRWDARQTSNWRDLPCWFSSECLPACLSETFPGFMKLWRDPDWNKVLRVAIHWYIESNAQAGAIEGAVVLQQLAFELLAARHFVEVLGKFTDADFYNPRKFPAVEKIRLLLSEANVPLAIPADLAHLSAQAQIESWLDGPTALTRLRNCITHPTGKNRQTLDRISISARAEACSLALWYLELTLLWLMGYEGYYFNRITAKFDSDVDLVPWARNPPGQGGK